MKKLFLSQSIAATFLMAMLLWAGYSFGQAPTVNYGGPQSYIIGAAITPLVPTSSGVAAPGYSAPIVTGSGLNQPFGIAIDGFGNVYVADAGNNAVKKIPAGGGTPVSLGSGFNNPKGIAFKAGNLYIADYGNNAVKKMPIAGGTPTTLATGLNSPEGISLDVAGNVYVTCMGDNSVKEILAADGTVVTVATGFNAPAALTIDAYGNVYVADSGNNQVQKIPATGGTRVTIGQGFSNPLGVAVDASGNVYVADSGNNHVKKIYASGGTPVVVASNFTPHGVIVDNTGNIYTIDYTNAVVKETKPAGGYYIHPALPRGLIMDNTTGAITGKPILLQAATTYTVTAYNSTGSVTSTLSIAVNGGAKPNISYPGPQTYTLNIPISPLSPANSGEPVPSFAGITFASGFNDAKGVAIDVFGNVYVADEGNNAVKKIPAGTNTPVSIGSGFSDPCGVAVDLSGNVYVADFGNNAVKEILTNGSILTLGSGFSRPYGIAVDAAGNIYVGDSGSNSVKKMPAGGGTPVTIGTGFLYPEGVALDAAGNVYVADYGNNCIKEITSSGGSTITLLSNISGVSAIAVDAAGQIFYSTNLSVPTIFMLPKGLGTPFPFGSGLYGPMGLGIDQNGFIYVGEGQDIKKISIGGYYVYPDLPAGLNLNVANGVLTGSATVASAATNYGIVAYNNGGLDTAIVNINISITAKPNISYPTTTTLTTGAAISAITPTNTGGPVPVQAITTLASNLYKASDIAVDLAGNVFVSLDEQGDGIYKIPARGGNMIRVGGSNYGSGIAVDGADNIYLCNPAGAKQVLKIAVGSSTGTVIGSGLVAPSAVAVDAVGNLYIADAGLTAIQEIPADGGPQISIGSGLKSPSAIAVDAAGNIYVVDAGGSEIKRIPIGGGSPIVLAAGYGPIYRIAVDAGGYVYFTSTAGTSKIIPDLGLIVQVPNATGFVIAVDQYNNLFFLYDGYQDLALKKINASGYSVAPALPAGLVLNTNTGVITGTPIVACPTQNYTVVANNGGGYSTFGITLKVDAAAAPSISYSTPHIYPVGAAISPISPVNTGGTVAAIYGITVASLAGNAFTIDAAGNYYVAQKYYTGNKIYQIVLKIGANGGPTDTVGIVPYFGETIKAITVDASGNVYFTGFRSNGVFEAPAGGGALITLGYVQAPIGIAVDQSGNVYVAASAGNAVYKIPPGGGTPVSIGSGFSDPTTLAIDNAGNLFITDRGHNAIKKLPAGSGTAVTLAVGVGTGIAVDGAGNVYYINSTGSISRLSAIGGTSTYFSNTYAPISLVANRSGSVFQYGGAGVVEIGPGGYFVNPALPAGLSLDINTGIISGTPSANHATTSYTISGYNAGGFSATTVSITIGALSTNATLAHFATSKGVLSPAFTSATTSYATTVSNTITSITVTPTTSESHATITVNGIAVTSGTASGALPLSVGSNTITTIVTAQDGTTTKTYTLTVTRAASNNAKLARLVISRGVLSPAFNAATTSYTAAVGNPITSITVTPTTSFAGATVTVNGSAVTSGTASAPVALATGPNTITTIVTAQDGTTTMTYTVTITRAGGSLNTVYQPVSVERPLSEPQIQDDGIIVHQGLSPNGDGINDFLLIENIANYPDNKLTIMNRSGQLVFEAKNYDNSTKVFDGHSNKTGAMQLPGTYFYSLDYAVNGVTKHKTGFVVLKY